MRQVFCFLLFILSLPLTLRATFILGQVLDREGKGGLADVTIQNVHTGFNTNTDSAGNFTIAATQGQLIEFRKLGYKTVRFRMPGGAVPSYFKIIMQAGPIELPEYQVAGGSRNYKKDSLEYYQLYKNALEFPQLTGLDVIQHPFSALSKRNRRIWAFQKEYAVFEREKYIDYTFNASLVKNLTGLEGDSAQYYLRKFRPTYEQLRSMNEYEFYDFIKESVTYFRTGLRRYYKPSIRRSNN